jgi:hypothetical protein
MNFEAYLFFQGSKLYEVDQNDSGVSKLEKNLVGLRKLK